MKPYGLLFLLCSSLSWAQAINSGSSLTAQSPAQTNAAAEATDRAISHASRTSRGSPDKPLITIAGLCDNPADKTADSNCKTVITQAQFQKVIDAVEPSMRVHARREFALHYAEVLVMAKRAEQMGLDAGQNYEEQMKLARIQVLSQQLKKVIQEKASLISEKDIEYYYRDNKARFEKAEIDRIYVPRIQQPVSAADKELSDVDRQKRSQESDQTMKNEADDLRSRAVAGEEFTKLQNDAYRVAAIKSTPPATSMRIRRISLPPNQVSVMDLKLGEISPVLADPNGYVIYKVRAKDMLSLDQARDEIKETLRSQRMQSELRSILDSATPVLDENYFAR